MKSSSAGAAGPRPGSRRKGNNSLLRVKAGSSERPAISVAFLANMAKIAGAGNHERNHLCR